MKRIAIFGIAALLAIGAAACNDDRPVVTPDPTPTSPATPEPNTNGPCHDGTVLRPNEQCP